jgi:hypothetical protein
MAKLLYEAFALPAKARVYPYFYGRPSGGL